jgi:hypothetical protein
MKLDLTQAAVRRLLDLDAATGIVRWRIAPNGRVPAGSVAGFESASGHLRVKIRGNSYPLHWIVWLYEFGAWPTEFIDHINGDPADNRPANLREATAHLNAQNLRRPMRTNKLGLLGVTRDRSRFRASIVVGGKKLHLGIFTTADAAHVAYVAAKRVHHPGCTL